MKLNKITWILLTAGVFAILLAGLSAVRSQQVQQQNQLRDELDLTQAKLTGIQLERLYKQQGELEKRLNQMLSQSETARATLSQPVESIATAGVLFDTAEAAGVSVSEVKISPLTSQKLEGVPASASVLSARVEGSLSGLIGFITRLNDSFGTGVVRSGKISIDEAKAETSASIEMVIYTYQGG
ncbi:MAG: hypothetical protein HY530_02400 [Chloroflexi bacterium]|nr:hypothetical protein [Chloroflexota bacterium]